MLIVSVLGAFFEFAHQTRVKQTNGLVIKIAPGQHTRMHKASSYGAELLLIDDGIYPIDSGEQFFCLRGEPFFSQLLGQPFPVPAITAEVGAEAGQCKGAQLFY